MPVQEVHQRQHRSLVRNTPLHVLRLTWSPERLAAYRRDRLRELLRIAKQRSPWHARRLARVDPETFTEAHLRELPTMGKKDVVANFEDVVTDRRITFARVLEHLETRPPGELLFDRYRVITSGGSTGQTAIWLYDSSAWNLTRLVHLRMNVRAQLRKPSEWLRKNRIAVIAADAPSHMSSAMSQSYDFDLVKRYDFSIAEPVARLVEALNEVQPTMIATYGSMLSELIGETRAGRLSIRPSRILSTSDRLLAETRESIERIWGAAVSDVWATSECGAAAAGCFEAGGMHLTDDLLIYEFVDLNDEPVRPGDRAAKVYVTNLMNHTTPLIRYELTDSLQLMEEPCPCGSTHRRVGGIEGRVEEAFHYGSIRMPPYPFRLVIEQDPRVLQYQVFQTKTGARIDIQASGPLNRDHIADRITREMKNHGLVNPKVEVGLVDEVERTATGKVRHFVPLDLQKPEVEEVDLSSVLGR